MEKPRKQAQESHSTQNGHEEQLLSEMGAKKKKEMTIKALLTDSFQKRRKWIENLGGEGTVGRALQR